MAGSWGHVTTRSGRLRGEDGTFGGMIDNLGDAYEAIEDAHGMVWWLAHQLAESATGDLPTRANVLAVIEQARQDHLQGSRWARNLR